MKCALTGLIALSIFTAAAFAASDEIVICEYNVENYVDGKAAGQESARAARPKSEKAIAALIHIISEINPDILGVCEMGSPERFEDFKKRLKAAGLGYVASEYVQGADPDRHLALVSRFPIVARNSAADVPYELNGQLDKVRRGFLDVTVEVHEGCRLRLVGAHLKSKLPAPEGEALIRRHEAQALRKHLEIILNENPETNLVCYGDFNDTKNEPAIAEISGVRGTPGYMSELLAKDEVGDRWTHYWNVADEYSRIDYILVSRALVSDVVKGKTRVYRGDDWNIASDHRPVFTSVVPRNRK